ncbi:18984_t:CDS:2 [Entrophospora sp. SA101]|nr:18984_t:CDS:2 [Entrophospora sp. SA101]
MKQQNNQLTTSAYQFRKRKFLTLILVTIVFFLLTLSYFTPSTPFAQETASKQHYSVITRTTEFVIEKTQQDEENDYPTITVSAADTATTTELMPPPSPSVEESTVTFPNNCTKDLSRNSNIFPNHYNLLLIISSRIEDFNQRKLLRKLLFNINDNLIPCMHQDNNEQPFHNIYYQFLVKNIKGKKTKEYDGEVRRNFIAEKMEFNDLTDITSDDGDDWQTSMLKWMLRKDTMFGHMPQNIMALCSS